MKRGAGPWSANHKRQTTHCAFWARTVRPMKNRIVFALLWSFFSVFALIGCDQQPVSQNPADYPASLMVEDSALEVAYDRNRGASQVRYQVDVPYPADGFVEKLGRRLSGQGWLPLSADFMNPDMPTAHVTGWQEQTDHRTRPPTEMRSWNGEWSSPAGDILIYVLAYSRPEGSTESLSRMSVVAVHIPKEAAEKAKAQVDKF